MMNGRTRTYALLALLLGSSACGTEEDDFPVVSGWDGGTGDDDGDGDGTTTVETGGETGDDPNEETTGFLDEGDVVAYQDNDGDATIDLTDISEEDPGSNRDQEFYLVLVNTGENELGYQLRYEETLEEDDENEEATAARRGRSAAPPSLSPMRQLLRQRIADGLLDHERAAPLAPPPPYDEADIGDAVQEFRVRNDLDDETESATVRAKLWAVGDSVTIWVDEFMPFNVYNDCDDLAQGFLMYDEEAFGFDNCDLATIANIVDTNIVPNLTTAYGEASDVNEDGKVSIVITPVLNRLTQGTDDEDLEGSLVGSYADPEVDLVDYDVDENPLSDEQEVIYVHAPDPYGYFNNEVRVDVDAYTGMDLAAQIARAYTRLISYNQKVLADTAGGEPETAWLIEGLGALAADLCGFGAVNYDDAWHYLDATHLYPLVTEEDAGAVSSESFGAQYLFLRWLMDTQEPADPSEGTLFEQMMSSTNTGVDSIESTVGRPFDELVVAWQVALLTTGVEGPDGQPLVDTPSVDNEDELAYPPFLAATLLTAPTENPVAGDYYGANGYQQGINVNGSNSYMEGGTTSAPEENVNNRVVTSGTDHFTLATGLPFFGYVAENYGAQVVRLVDIPYDTASLVVDGNESNYTGVVVRWSDPGEADYVIEDVFSSTSSATVELPRLNTDGDPIYGLGIIGSPGATFVVDETESDGDDTAAPEFESGDIYDTDKYLLDLSGFSPADVYRVAVEFSRHYANADGDIGPSDPWVAIVPREYIPLPTVDGTNSDSCPERNPAFQYPESILDHLFWQVYLSPQAVGTNSTVTPFNGDESSLEGDGFDPCGAVEDGAISGDGVSQLSCADDWDRDGVYDEDEPQPDSLLQQVWVMQCTASKGSSGIGSLGAGDYLTDEFIDRDELDDDDAAYADLTRNLGGISYDQGEEAYLELSLQGGQQYILVVGAGSDEGPYEFSIKVLDASSR